MKPERWQQLDELFQSVLEREPEEREMFLDEACAGNDELRQQVDALLAAHERAGSFIENPALEVEARSLAKGQRMGKPSATTDLTQCSDQAVWVRSIWPKTPLWVAK